MGVAPRPVAPAIRILVGLHALPYEERKPLHVMHAEHLLETFEAVEARVEQVLWRGWRYSRPGTEWSL